MREASSPLSFNGFTATISAPLRLAACSEPRHADDWSGFGRNSSASSNLQAHGALADAELALRAPLIRGNMFEQSGRLLAKPPAMSVDTRPFPCGRCKRSSRWATTVRSSSAIRLASSQESVHNVAPLRKTMVCEAAPQLCQ